MMFYTSQPTEVLFRTSGDIHLSDYMVWQTNHSLIHFVPKLLSQFTSLDLASSVLMFQLTSNAQHFLHDFSRWTSPNLLCSFVVKTTEKMERFNKKYQENAYNQILDGNVKQKTMLSIENFVS